MLTSSAMLQHAIRRVPRHANVAVSAMSATVLPTCTPYRSLSATPNRRATESPLFGPLGVTNLALSRSEVSSRMARSLFSTIEEDELAKAALGRVIHLSQRAGISPKTWLDSPDDGHPLRQLMQNKPGSLISLAESDVGFREAVERLKAEFSRLGVTTQLELLFALVDAQSKPPNLDVPS